MLDQIRGVEATLEDLYKQEELLWARRSRIDWLECGDRKTHFFHTKASRGENVTYMEN